MGSSEHSKLPYSATTPTTGVNYMHVVPNSHFWTDLKQLTDSIEFGWLNPEIGKEFILIGLQNTINNGYRFKLFSKDTLINTHDLTFFVSIEEMIEYVRSAEYKESTFYLMLLNTLKVSFNLTNGLKMERKDVYKLIDGERNYQDATWVARRTADGTPDEEKDVAEWINYMEFHLQKAKNAVYYLDRQAALAEVRKVAALGVRAMEIHGAPERIMQSEPNSGCCGGDCGCKKSDDPQTPEK